MKHSTLNYASKKAMREASWSAVIIIVMFIGQTALVTIPSIASSLQAGVQDYANAAATYIVISNNGNPSARNQTILPTLLTQLRLIPGIQETYPVVTNYTLFLNPARFPHVHAMGFLSAVIGGDTGYPEQLLSLAAGRIPKGDEAGFVVNLSNGVPYNLSDTASVSIASVNFTAKESGISNYSPLLGENLGVLWNSSFVRSELGSGLFQKTFGKGVNFVIVKAASVQDVAGVIPPLTRMLSGYPDYVISYDKATVDNLISLQKGVTPLYDLLGLVSVAFAIVATLTISYIAATRRAWEAGLMLSQGWSWNIVRNFFFLYFLILSEISLVLSIMASYVISNYSSANYEVYGGFIHVPVSLKFEYLLTAGIISAVVPLFASIFIVWRIRKIGLDRILREF